MSSFKGIGLIVPSTADFDMIVTRDSDPGPSCHTDYGRKFEEQRAL